MNTISLVNRHGGTQGLYSHRSSSCKCEMTFAVFVPPGRVTKKFPLLWFLSGSGSRPNDTIEAAGYQRLAASLGLMVVCPDTSPRGEGLETAVCDTGYTFASGLYLDATREPFSKTYRMYSYLVDELADVIGKHFPADIGRQGILGHSMGGLGALSIALKNPDRFQSCSTFSAVTNPIKCDLTRALFEDYLGMDVGRWRAYDACALVQDGRRLDHILVNQPAPDEMLAEGLRSAAFRRACEFESIPLEFRVAEGCGDGMDFVSALMDDHLEWHSKILRSRA